MVWIPKGRFNIIVTAGLLTDGARYGVWDLETNKTISSDLSRKDAETLQDSLNEEDQKVKNENK